MSSPLPFVVRVAAGLVAEAVDVVRRLPEELPGLPIALAGQAARASMRLNQHLTDWAAKGDTALAGLPFGQGEESEPAERTPWSRIDDEDGVEVAGDPGVEDPGVEDPGVPPLPSEERGTGTAPSDDTGPVPGFDGLTLSELRHVLKELTAPEVAELVTYEQEHQNRASFLTLLSNRLTTLEHP
ncbi:hypothetical protein D1871_21370 [Nakamurella silvestris]|nr:hypothetical protein D1871_21370 [Nakamurella silvestris]